MKNSQDTLTKISTITREIEENYPELQKYLKETRSTLPGGLNQSSKIDENELDSYFNELKEMVNKYKNKE